MSQLEHLDVTLLLTFLLFFGSISISQISLTILGFFLIQSVGNSCIRIFFLNVTVDPYLPH